MIYDDNKDVDYHDADDDNDNLNVMMRRRMMTIGCLPGDEDVAWFGDDHSVLPLGKRVQQQREALQSLKRDVGERHLYF